MQTFLKILIGSFLAFVVVLIFWPVGNKSDPSEYISNAKYDSVQIELEYLKAENEKIKDSIFGLNVEKGYLEIEINKSQARIEERIVAHDIYKVQKDTVKIVQNCDSIVSDLHYYIPIIDTLIGLDSISDSLHWKLIQNVDTSWNIIYQETEDLKKDNAIVTDENKRLKIKNKAGKKKNVLITLGSFIIGMITTLLITK